MMIRSAPSAISMAISAWLHHCWQGPSGRCPCRWQLRSCPPHGIAERPVETGGIFRRIGHDHNITETYGIEPLTDGQNTPVHHIRRGNDRCPGTRLNNGLADKNLNGFIIGDLAVADDPVMTVGGERVKGDIGNRPISGTASRTAVTQRQTRLPPSVAFDPSSSLSSASIRGKAIAGMPRSRARCAWLTASAIESLFTPGSASTCSGAPLPSRINSGQIRLSTSSFVSRTSRRPHSRRRGAFSLRENFVFAVLT